jgi:glycogen operon protein
MSRTPPTLSLGPTLENHATRFRVFSRHAERLWLCLLAPGSNGHEVARLPFERVDDDIWEVLAPGVGPGAEYGLRAEGAYAPESGHRFDPSKLLVDPYARAVTGEMRWTAPLSTHGQETGGVAPRSLLAASAFDWQGDRAPRVPWQDTVIYEAHVRGLTRAHPDLPEELRGTYLGLTHPSVVQHLQRLGVTTIELLPVQQAFDERHLVERGLSNYWGYNPVAFFAPHGAYASGEDPLSEFKEMVRRLHQAGFEVLLDLVFNHTAEGPSSGPTLSLRGLDNAVYYRADPAEVGGYANWSGCGNSLDFGRPEVVRLAIDCLRYWVDEMHVDGFRLDLATVLGRAASGSFAADAPFFEAVAGDPVLSRVKLIAEPWDVGPKGYQLGQFPPGWREWNDRFRDAVRGHWQGRSKDSAELAARLAGSPDLFGTERGGATASINYITAHDGFTLADLVSYSRKRNEANGEGNGDGHNHRLSHGWGAEGPTDDRSVLARRRRARRGMLASLALAEGVPMISHGDELGRTQRGNNNAYCQDNEISWVDWRLDEPARRFLDFARWLFALRKRLRSRKLVGRSVS